MAALIRKLHDFVEFMANYDPDPRTRHYPLMERPWTFLGIICFYVYFITKLGPRLMANRRPFELKKTLLVFNGLQIIACSYLFVSALRFWGVPSRWLCYPIDTTDTEGPKLVFFYWVLKMADLLDTVFFVLRKKSSQVSFLHVYHHVGMSILSYSAVKYIPGGHDTSLGFINSLVHAFMYSYYLATALWPETKNTGFKKFITQLQMMQFFINVVHSLVLLLQPNCEYPKFTIFIIVPQNLFMLMLFADFYIKNYVAKKSPTA